VFSARKRTEKLRYMHRNPVKRGFVQNPEDWKWSSYRHYLTGTEGVVEIESHWLARQKERMGIVPKLKYTKLKEPADSTPHPSPKPGERVGHPRMAPMSRMRQESSTKLFTASRGWMTMDCKVFCLDRVALPSGARAT
jgi:hypothetical protein